MAEPSFTDPSGVTVAFKPPHRFRAAFITMVCCRVEIAIGNRMHLFEQHPDRAAGTHNNGEAFERLDGDETGGHATSSMRRPLQLQFKSDRDIVELNFIHVAIPML